MLFIFCNYCIEIFFGSFKVGYLKLEVVISFIIIKLDKDIIKDEFS